jgi:putative transposase
LSRQYIYKTRKAVLSRNTTRDSIIEKVKKVREKHKNMGSRVMYYYLDIKELGINKFEEIISKSGFGVKIRKKRIKTTNGIYEYLDKNLINGKVLNDINQVIAGDITYLILKDKNYYIFTLKDMYSKRIIGLYGSDNMLAINALKTMQQVTKLRGKNIYNCIHHTDAGLQYKSLLYKNELRKNKMEMSIAENCLQNGMAEQLNGVIKNDYLEGKVKNVKDLNRQLSKIKKLLNNERPVKELGYRTPIEFENWLKEITIKPEIRLYDFTDEGGGTLNRHKQQKKFRKTN